MLILKKVCFYHGFAGGGLFHRQRRGVASFGVYSQIVIWREIQNHWKPGLTYAPCMDTYDRPSTSSWVRLGIL